MISEAWGIPLGAEKCVIERDKALDLIDEIKAQFPNELAEARRLVDARAEFITNAKREADGIRKTAEDRARQLVEEQEVIKVAKSRANELLMNAETQAADLKRAANEYVDDSMRRTEEALAAALDEMRQTRSRFRSASGRTRSGDTGRIDIPLE
jgi:cell division septum initiation protein DivIVA